MVVYTLEQRWEILRQIDLQKMPILAKKIIFSDEAHFDLEKLTRPKRVTVWCDFWSRGIIGQFFFENEQGEAVEKIFSSFFKAFSKKKVFGGPYIFLYRSQR